MFKKLGIYLRKKVFKVEFLFLFIALIGFYCILPPSLDFGDQSSNGLVVQKILIDYQKDRKNFNGNFEDYFKQRYVSFHGDKIFSFNSYETYGLDPKLKLNAYLDPTNHLVFVLSKLSELAIYYLSFALFNIEVSLKLLGLIIFILTYVYAIKLGTLLKDKKFGLILAVITTSNIYFNQLARSMIFPFLTFYPLLVFSSFYYLLHVHLQKNKNRTRSLLGLSISVAFCFINAYPHTNFLLLGLLGIFFLGFFIYLKFFKNEKYTLLSLREYFFAALFSFSIVFITTAIWSNLLGQNLFYAFNKILHDRVWGLIFLHQPFVATSFIPISGFWKIPYYFINAFEVLFISSRLHFGPHEASFLNDLSFLNPLEGIFFFLGLYYLFKNIRSKSVINYWLIILGVFSFWQLFSHYLNYLTVSRITYNFYFTAILFVAYGLSNIKKLPLVILLASLLININKFNTKFVSLFDESLQQMSGLHQLRELYQNEISKGNNLFLYDYNLYTGGYEYHIDLISLLEGKIDYDLTGNFFKANYIDSLSAFKQFLKQGLYENVYIVQPVGVIQFGKELRGPVKAFHYVDRKSSPWFSTYDPYKVIKNRRGSPTFFVYKFSGDYPYYTTKLENNKNSYQVDFEGKEKVKYIDFPGGLKSIEIEFIENIKLKLDFGKLSFDRFHFDFGKNSIIDVYNNFNYGDELANIIKNEAKLTHGDQDWWGIARVDLFDPVNNPSNVLFEYQMGFPIEKVHLVIPFVFYNDQSLQNELVVSYKTAENNSWKKLASRESNRSMQITDYNHLAMPGSYGLVYNTNNNYSFFRVLNLNSKTTQLFVDYKISAFTPPAVRPYSLTYFPEDTFNFLEFEVDTSEYKEYKEIETESLKINVEFKESQKENPHNLISIGTY